MAFAGPAPVLVLSHAAKSFGAVQALLDGSIELHPGEVHALVGENGAGKSTLVKILAGVYQPDAGALLVDGQEVTLHSPAMALAAGIAVIYQEPALFPDLTVAEDMLSGGSRCGPGGASTGGRCARRRRRSSPASGSGSTRRGSRAACPSRTSRSSRSARRSRWRPGSS